MSNLDEVRRLEERLREGDASADPDTSAVFDELLADDVLFVQPDGTSVGKSRVVQAHRAPRKRTFSAVASREVELRDFGPVVAVTCRTDYTLPDRSFAVRILRLWRRDDRSWKVVVVAMQTIPADDRA